MGGRDESPAGVREAETVQARRKASRTGSPLGRLAFSPPPQSSGLASSPSAAVSNDHRSLTPETPKREKRASSAAACPSTQPAGIEQHWSDISPPVPRSASDVHPPVRVESIRRLTVQQKPASPILSKEQRIAQREWRETSQLLNQRAELLSRDLPATGSQLASARADASLIEALREVTAEAEVLSASRQKEETELLANLRKARQDTAEFGALLSRLESGECFLSKLRRVVSDAAERIRKAREASEMRRAALATDEARLTSELAELASTFNAWGTQTDKACAKPESRPLQRGHVPRAGSAAACTDIACRNIHHLGSNSRRDTEGVSATDLSQGSSNAHEMTYSEAARLRQEVEAMEAEMVRLGGATCGWDEGDHAIFLRARTQIFGASRAHHAFEAAAAAIFAEDGASADRRRVETYGCALLPGGGNRASAFSASGDSAVESNQEANAQQEAIDRNGHSLAHANETSPDSRITAGHLQPEPSASNPLPAGYQNLSLIGLQLVSNAREAALVDRAVALLGAYGKHQIVEHAVRTARRDMILARRKNVLAAWRRVRDQQRDAASTARAFGAEMNGEAALMDATTGTDEQSGVSNKSPIGSRTNSTPRNSKQAAKLREWRETRIRKAQEAEENRKVQEQKSAEAAMEAARKRQKERQAMAATAARRREEQKAEAEAAARRLAEEKEFARARRALDFVPLRARDDQIARRRLAARRALKEKQAARAVRFENLAELSKPDLGSAGRRDHARLLRPTVAARSRMYATQGHEMQDRNAGAARGEDSRRGRPAPPVSSGSRATPSWRAKLVRG